MAEEKKDEKPKRGADDRRSKMYDKSSKKEEKKPEPKSEKKGEGDKKAEGGEAEHPHVKAMGEMNKRHEAERREHHGNERAAKRKMDDRHMQEMQAMMAQQSAQPAGAAGAEGPAAGAGAPAAGAAAPQGGPPPEGEAE